MRKLRPREENSITKGTHLSPFSPQSSVRRPPPQNTGVVVTLVSMSPGPDTAPDPGRGSVSVLNPGLLQPLDSLTWEEGQRGRCTPRIRRALLMPFCPLGHSPDLPPVAQPSIPRAGHFSLDGRLLRLHSSGATGTWRSKGSLSRAAGRFPSKG